MKTKFTLGQAVEITGQYVQKMVTAEMVDKVEARIKASGRPEISRKYNVAKFDHPKQGVVVGIRSIAGERIHYMDPSHGEVTTKTNRQAAYLIATDMRGLVYVPLDSVDMPKTRGELLRKEFGDWVDRNVTFDDDLYDDDFDDGDDDDFDVDFEEELIGDDLSLG